MLTQVLTVTFSLFSDAPVVELLLVTPRAEELPEIASASRNHTCSEETIESRLFVMLDH